MRGTLPSPWSTLPSSKYTGWKREEIIGRKATELVHPDDLPLVLERHRARLRGEDAHPGYEIRYLTKDGTVRGGFITPTVIPQTHQTLIAMVDITEAKEARRLLEAIFLNAPVAIFIAQDNCLKMANSHLIVNFGYNEQEVVGIDVSGLIHPEDREKVREAIREIIRGKRPEPFEFRAVRKDGSTFWAFGMVTSIITYEGRPAALGLVVNIDQQKRLQEQLALEKAWAEALIENAPLIVIGLGERSKILLFNRFAEKVTGWRREQVLGKEWIELFVPSELKDEIWGVWEYLVSTRPVSHEYENPIRTRDGSSRVISGTTA